MSVTPVGNFTRVEIPFDLLANDGHYHVWMSAVLRCGAPVAHRRRAARMLSFDGAAQGLEP